MSSNTDRTPNGGVASLSYRPERPNDLPTPFQTPFQPVFQRPSNWLPIASSHLPTGYPHTPPYPPCVRCPQRTRRTTSLLSRPEGAHFFSLIEQEPRDSRWCGQRSVSPPITVASQGIQLRCLQLRTNQRTRLSENGAEKLLAEVDGTEAEPTVKAPPKGASGKIRLRTLGDVDRRTKAAQEAFGLRDNIAEDLGGWDRLSA